MDGESTKVLLVTANVGSIFEEPAQMFQPWMQAFLQDIKQKEPGVVALHCQEVGGKNYEANMQHVNHFVKNLLACEELQKYDRARIFLDEDYTAADRFTALGNLYFIHEDIDSVLIWDFVDCKFVAVEGREVLSGNIENVPIKEKAKFPQHFFPEFKWSRKGFLRTRWSVNNCIFDLINIHLFHDASNIVAMESSPSLYCGNRKRALLHTLQRFENDQYSKVPLFIFGDFNFRLDSCSLIKALTPTAVAQQTLGKKDQVNKVVYTEEGNGKVVLTVETKSFDCHERHADVFSNMIKWLMQYDLEPKEFQDRLCEFDVTFPPSYPFIEDVTDGLSYMKTRVPSWCDRILLSHGAKDVVSSESQSKPEYGLIGSDICMGDHKPVSLFVRMRPGKGNDLSAPTTTTTSTTSTTSPSTSPSPSRESFVSHILDLSARRRGLSINGEAVPERELESVNIHDFAIFEKEQELIPEFRVSIKSRSSVSSEGLSPTGGVSPRDEIGKGGVGWLGLGLTGQAGEGGGVLGGGSKMSRTPSFKRVAHQVMMVERVLLRWPCRPRGRHHSSSSEDYCCGEDGEDSTTTTTTNTTTNNNNHNHHHRGQVGKGGGGGVKPELDPGSPVFLPSTPPSSGPPNGSPFAAISSSCKTSEWKDSDRTNASLSPVANLHNNNNSSSCSAASPSRDVNLNEKKTAAPNTSDRREGEGGQSFVVGVGSENSKVVDRGRQAPPPTPLAAVSQPECCADSGGVVVAHERGPRPAGGKAAAAVAVATAAETKDGKGKGQEEGGGERQSTCPCVLL
ncbi:hypothetical protein ACOMHN_025316 [Nucella lapillus]